MERSQSHAGKKWAMSTEAGTAPKEPLKWEFHDCHPHNGSLRGLSGKESTCSVQTWVLSLGWGDLLEEEMATYSRILA